MAACQSVPNEILGNDGNYVQSVGHPGFYF